MVMSRYILRRVASVADKRCSESQDIHSVFNTYRFSTATLVIRTRLCYVIRTVKVKVKFTLDQATKAQRGSRGIALLLLQFRRWMGVGGQRHAADALPPARTRYPFYRRLGGPQSRSGQVLKISPLPGFDPRTVQPVASCYTDYGSLRHTHSTVPILLRVVT